MNDWYYSSQRKAEEEETAYAERATRIREHGEDVYTGRHRTTLETLAEWELPQRHHSSGTPPYADSHAVSAGDHADVELNP